MHSSFQKKDFRNPFHKTGTFGVSKGSTKYNVKQFDRDYSVEFRGRDSPPVGIYDPVLGNMGKKPLFESKSMPRCVRGNIFVSKFKLSIPYVAPNTYQKVDLMSDFKKKTGPGHFGSKAARNTDVRMFAQ